MVCHGPVALLSANLTSPSSPWPYKGYNISVFDTRSDHMKENSSWGGVSLPWYPVDEISRNGGVITNAATPYVSNVVTSKELTTGQNPQSAFDLSVRLGQIMTRYCNLKAVLVV